MASISINPGIARTRAGEPKIITTTLSEKHNVSTDKIIGVAAGLGIFPEKAGPSYVFTPDQGARIGKCLEVAEKKMPANKLRKRHGAKSLT